MKPHPKPMADVPKWSGRLPAHEIATEKQANEMDQASAFALAWRHNFLDVKEK
jgi:hypothetical protein